MRRVVCLTLLVLLNVLSIDCKKVPKRFQDKPRSEFVSMGSMDDEIHNSALVENTRVARLNVSMEKLVEKYSTMRPKAQPLVQHIEKLQIQPPNSQSTMIDKEMYPKAVEVLRKIVPNLQTVTLIGSYMFKPGNENRPDVIKDEIVFVRSYLKTVINAFRAQNITVENVRFVVGMIVPDKTQAQVDFGRLIRSNFGYQINPEELESKTVGMIVQMNETTVYLGIGMNPSKQEKEWLTPTSIIAVGRSRFLEQAILTNFKREWFSRVLDLVNTEPSPKHVKHRVNDLSRHRMFSNSVAADDSKVRAVGRTSDLPRRLFSSQRDMDFMQFQQAPQLQLEDFFDKHVDSIQVERQIERLGLKVTVQNRTTVTNEQMYRSAVENLKKLVPNLREVNLYGGYVYQPRKPTRDSVQNEIEFMAETIRNWINAFNEANITVTDIRFIANFVVPNKIRETSQYDEGLKNTFHYTPTTTELEQNSIRMRVELNSVPCRIGIHFRDTGRDQTSCPLPMGIDTFSTRIPQFNYFCNDKRLQHWFKSVWSNQQFNW